MEKKPLGSAYWKNKVMTEAVLKRLQSEEKLQVRPFISAPYRFSSFLPPPLLSFLSAYTRQSDAVPFYERPVRARAREPFGFLYFRATVFCSLPATINFLCYLFLSPGCHCLFFVSTSRRRTCLRVFFFTRLKVQPSQRTFTEDVGCKFEPRTFQLSSWSIVDLLDLSTSFLFDS